MSMNLYDNLLEDIMNLLKTRPGRILPFSSSGGNWPDSGDYSLILRGEMAYELGGNNLAAVSGLGFTSSKHFVDQDEIWLYGQDLPELKKDTPYARLTLLRVSEDGLGEGDEAYTTMRKVEYTRYHINPKGYMMRISVASEREPVRVSRVALKDGLNFAKVGELFLTGYHKHPKVLAAKLIFITLPDFPYEELNRIVRQADKITESLNHIFNDLKMDCSVCNLKPVCDEVEGMKELHFSQAKKNESLNL